MAPKKCKTGKSCGMGCISSTKTCRVQLSPQVSEALEELPYRQDSGGDARVRVYQELGFGGMIEKDQWAIKLDGLLVPVTEEFYRKHIEKKKKWDYKGM